MQLGWTNGAYEGVSVLLQSRTGLAFTEHRRSAAEAGIRRAMSSAGVRNVDEYLQRLRVDPVTFAGLVSELTVGETYFFREPAQFQFIRESIVTGLRHPAKDALRVWSAGCASGEEAYSLAIVLQEEGFGGQASVLATDISLPALERTREAVYSRWALRGADATFVSRYFHEADGRFALTHRIRDRVTIESLNLAADSYPSLATRTVDMDLVLCRNVLIYLDADTILRVAQHLQECLAPGGWLITGPSDPLLPVAPFCEAVYTPAGVFYRRTAARAVDVIEHQSDGLRPLPPTAEPPASTVVAVANCMVEARAAMVVGDYSRVLDLTAALPDEAVASELRVQALANLGAPELALQTVVLAVARHPTSLELHFLNAVLLVGLGRESEAVDGLRRLLYLDRSLTFGHLLLGSILQRLHHRQSAVREYRTAYALAVNRPADEIVPLSDGESAGRLAEAARMKLSLLGVRPDVTH